VLHLLLVVCSLPIHLPQCQAKWQQQQALLPPTQRLPLPQPPAAVAAILGGDSTLLPAGRGFAGKDCVNQLKVLLVTTCISGLLQPRGDCDLGPSSQSRRDICVVAVAAMLGGDSTRLAAGRGLQVGTVQTNSICVSWWNLCTRLKVLARGMGLL
jgi:hypothetical protein